VPMSLTVESLFDYACDSTKASPICICICICVRLRAPRLLRPSYESPLTPWGRRSWPVFPLPRALPVFPPRWAVWSPSRRRRVAVASLSSRSRAPRLLRPSSESLGCTGYQIGPRRGALTSFLGRALTSSLRWIVIYYKKNLLNF